MQTPKCKPLKIVYVPVYTCLGLYPEIMASFALSPPILSFDLSLSPLIHPFLPTPCLSPDPPSPSPSASPLPVLC